MIQKNNIFPQSIYYPDYKYQSGEIQNIKEEKNIENLSPISLVKTALKQEIKRINSFNEKLKNKYPDLLKYDR